MVPLPAYRRIVPRHVWLVLIAFLIGCGTSVQDQVPADISPSETVTASSNDESPSTDPPKSEDKAVSETTTAAATVSLDWLEETPEGELELDKQKYIWEAEHITFEIEKRFGGKFKSAIAARDKQQIAALIRDDFHGKVFLPSLPGATATHGLLSQQTRTGKAEKSVDRNGFVEDLLQSLEAMKQIENVGMRVLKIDRVKDNDQHNRWWTEILLTATGRGAKNELLAFDSHQHVEFQYNEKNELDGEQVVASWDTFSHRLRTSERMLMQEATSEYGLPAVPLQDNWTTKAMPQQWHYQMAVEDYDRDGFLDIAIATLDGKPILLRSMEGKKFEDVSQRFAFAPWDKQQIRYLATWIDFDNDGFPDLILGSRLYRNVGGKSFDDVTDASGLTFGNRPMGCAIADYDADGFLDIYVTYQNSGRPKDGKPLPWVGDNSSGQFNTLWHNEGNGTFTDVTKKTATSGGLRNSLAASWMYTNDDNRPDLYVANDFGTNVMFHSRADGGFDDVSEATGLADYATSMGVASGDINNDGRPEIYVANMYSKMGRRIIAHVNEDDYTAGIHTQIKGACAGNRLYQYDEKTKRYKDLSVDLHVNGIGWAFAPAMADLDNDGLLDMYATTGFMSFDRKKPDG